MPQATGQVLSGASGTANATQGTPLPLRQGGQGDLIVSELQGRFYEATFRGDTYVAGSTAVTALSANTIGLTQTATPIVGVWNPLSSNKNLIINQAALMNFINNVTSVAPGAYVWAVATGQSAISTGANPMNRRNLAAFGSVAKAFNGGVALTGLVGSLTIMEPADFPLASGLLTTTVAAATPTPGVVGVQNFDGSLIVPPGGVLALLNTVSTTTHSVTARLLWNEAPVNQ
jgi:hypothetical protein